MLLRFAVIAAALVLVSLPARAADPHAEFFGIRLGSPLALPSCDDVDAKRAAPLNGLCATPDLGADPDGPKTVTGRFDGGPDYAADQLRITLDGAGNVQGIDLETTGIQSQQEVLVLLKQKFGKPYRQRVTAQANMMGAKFKVITAAWIVGTDFIQFDGASSSFDSGFVAVVTLAEKARRAEHFMKASDPRM